MDRYRFYTRNCPLMDKIIEFDLITAVILNVITDILDYHFFSMLYFELYVNKPV